MSLSFTILQYLLLAGLSGLSLSSSLASPSPRPLEGKTINCCTALHYPTVFPEKHGVSQFSTPANHPSLHYFIFLSYGPSNLCISQKYGLDGLAVNYLGELEERLGFKCGSMDVRNSSSELSFTELIKEMYRCSKGQDSKDSLICRCEFVVGAWFRTTERHGMVRFLPPFSSGEYRVLVHKDSTVGSNKGLFFLSVFSPAVWGLIFALFVLYTFLLLMIPRFQPPENYSNDLDRDAALPSRIKHFFLKTKPLRRLRKAAQSVLESLINFNSPQQNFTSNSNRQWVLQFIIALSGLFLVLVFESAMTASLVQESFISEYRTIEDLRNCRINMTEVCIPAGGAIESIWHTSLASSKCHGGQLPRMIESYEQAIQEVAEKRCRYLVIDSLAGNDAITGKYCGKLIATGEPLFWGGLSSIVSRNFSYYNEFSKATLNMLEEGMRLSMDDFFKKRGSCVIHRTSTLSLRQLLGFFITALSAIALLFVWMIIDTQRPPEINGNGSSAGNDDQGTHAEKYFHLDDMVCP